MVHTEGNRMTESIPKLYLGQTKKGGGDDLEENLADIIKNYKLKIKEK